MGSFRGVKGERGSSTVFLLLVLAGLLALLFVYMAGAKTLMGRAYKEDVLHLAGRSVLAEYDRELWRDYGIMAFAGSGADIQGKVSMYGNYSLDMRRSLTLGELRISLGAYSLADPEAFRKEIVSHTRYALARGLLEDLTLGTGEGTEEAPLFLEGRRTLRNHQVIDSLPSGGLSSGGHLWEALKNAFTDMGGLLEKGTDNYLLNRYIFAHFAHAQEQELPGERFFHYEVEYILEGKLSDEENRKAFRRELLALRNAVNLVFLLADPKKRDELMAAAELLAPGPGAPLMMALLAEGWALLEAENDLQLLEHGKKVPFYKDEDNWATDLKSILENEESAYIDTHCDVGMCYRDYLLAFLFVQEGRSKVLRVMDLIQINMKGRYDRHFTLQDHYLGFAMGESGGKERNYAHTYGE